MSQDFKILAIDTKSKTMVINWGFVTLNHDIPLYILENPQLTQEQMLQQIAYMRPPTPVEYAVPSALLDLVEPTQGLAAETEVIEGEVLL